MSRLGFLACSTMAVPHQLLAPGAEVLVIGVGGGLDVMTAPLHQAGSMTGAEIRRPMVKTLLNDLQGFTGHVSERPDVRFEVAEGRSLVRHIDRRYDLIQLLGVDTDTPCSPGPSGSTASPRAWAPSSRSWSRCRSAGSA